jgi:hypothetical protein
VFEGEVVPRRLLLSTLLCAVIWPGTAGANPFGYHEHDGFYLRFGGGLSLIGVDRETDRSGSQGSLAFEGSSEVGGVALNAEVSVGGTPLRKLVIAGTALLVTLPAADLKLGSGARLNLDSSLNFFLLAPTADVYLDPNRGFHFGGGLGFAVLHATVAADPSGAAPNQFSTFGGIGVGVTMHAGYDFWVGDDWCLGGQVRGVLARVNGDQSTANVSVSERDSVAAISLVFTALYH